MATILHPVTQISGSPSYTAQQIRRTVNPFIALSNNSPFDTVQGVRAGCGVLLSISGNTVTVKRHAGQLSPFSGYGIYHYSIDSDMQVTVPSLTASYKIAMVMSDKSLGQGTGNTITPTVLDYSTADSSVNGLVLGAVVNGTCSDTALRINPTQELMAFKLSDLPSLNMVEGQRALVTSDGDNNGEYTYMGGAWCSSYTHQFWKGKAKRSDGQLAINSGITYFTITNAQDGGLPVQLVGDAHGTKITGLHGDYLMRIHLQLDGAKAWTSLGYELHGNASVVLGDGAEMAKPSGFGSLDIDSVVRFTTASDGIVPIVNSNPDQTMRNPMGIAIMKL